MTRQDLVATQVPLGLSEKTRRCMGCDLVVKVNDEKNVLNNTKGERGKNEEQQRDSVRGVRKERI